MRIGIVGLGLIGGSLGLDLRQLGHQVFGVARRSSTGDRAVVRGAVDAASCDLKLLSPTEVIYICTPIAAIVPTLEELLPHLQAETIITDVGSVKVAVVEQATALGVNFVGGHPMAGTAQQGIEAAMSGLFCHAPYVLTPMADTPRATTETVAELARALGAIVYTCTPQAHDRAVARISHLPVMVSAALIDSCFREEEGTVLELAQRLASSGFRDTSRVGGGNPELGTMMARYNRRALLQTLADYRQSIAEICDYIEREDWQALEAHLETMNEKRSRFGFGRSN